MRSQAGFNLTEVMIAMACATLLLLGVATVTTNSIGHKMRVLGKLDSIQQNSELRDLIFSAANQNASTCMSRLGIAPNSLTLSPTKAILPTPTIDTDGVSIDELYLVEPIEVRTVGTNREYSALVKVKQQLSRSTASLADTSLGMMSLVVNSSNRIVSCNWDTTTIAPMEPCDDSTGTKAGGSTCFSEPALEIITTCPTGLTMSQAGRCIPINQDCYNQYLGSEFDGNKFGCLTVPPGYAIRYPSGYTAPHAPAQGAQASVPATGGEATTTPASPCTCGSQSIPPGGPKLCVKKTSKSEGFGNYDDLFEVKRCNTAGHLESNAPNGWVFYEEGNGNNWSWKVATCTYSGGFKNLNGISYTRGNCQ